MVSIMPLMGGVLWVAITGMRVLRQAADLGQDRLQGSPRLVFAHVHLYIMPTHVYNCNLQSFRVDSV